MQAESGLMAITGEADGVPTRFGVAIIDLVAGMTATQSILAALLQARTTGEGQFIDVALLDCALNMLVNVGTGYLNTGSAPKRFGNAHPTVVPYQIFETSDGSFALAVGTDKQFATLCRDILNMPDLAEDTRFITAKNRAVYRDELIARLAPAFRTDTCDHWLDLCRHKSVPAGAVKDVPGALTSPSATARDVVQTLDHPHLGSVRMVRSAHGLAAQKTAPQKAPPMLGQDTDEVLRRVLGYDDERISHLKDTGAVAQYQSDKEGS